MTVMKGTDTREYRTHSPEETEALGEKLAAVLRGGEVLAFTPGMEMAKTGFTRGLARGVEIAEGVSSPTFALVHEHQGRLPLYHFDMFRVSGWDDLYSTGFFDYLDMGAVLAIEWSENIEGALPDETITIAIRPGEGDNERVISISGLTEDLS